MEGWGELVGSLGIDLKFSIRFWAVGQTPVWPLGTVWQFIKNEKLPWGTENHLNVVGKMDPFAIQMLHLNNFFYLFYLTFALVRDLVCANCNFRSSRFT